MTAMSYSYKQAAAPLPSAADLLQHIGHAARRAVTVVVKIVAAELARANTRKQLNGLSNRMLDDIGLTRGDLEGRF